MHLDIQFLTHYRGQTKTDAKSKERIEWASTAVDLRHEPPSAYELVFQGKPNPRDEPHDGKIYSRDGEFWAVAEATNVAVRHEKNGYNSRSGSQCPAGLQNFQIDFQRRFAWNTFGFVMFGKDVQPGTRGIVSSNVKPYKPGAEIEWDDTVEIGKRVSRFYEENLVVVDDLVFCRIEDPVFMVPLGENELIPMMTPKGGFGSAVSDWRRVSRDVDDVRRILDGGVGADEAPVFRLDLPSDQYELPVDIMMRSVVYSLFVRHPWLVKPYNARQKAEVAAVFKQASDLVLGRVLDLTDADLDKAADILLPSLSFVAGSSIQEMIQAWIDRPISV